MDARATSNLKQQSASIFEMLVSRQLTERYHAIELFDDPAVVFDIPLLRTLISDAVRTDYQVGREDSDGDPSIQDTRSWLLSGLGRLSKDDEAATEEVLRHVDRRYEQSRRVRYWALEGLIAGKNPKAREASEAILLQQDEPLVGMLANAYLASMGDIVARDRVRQRLADTKEESWPAFRALRVVLLPFSVETLCETVERCEFADSTYDAIVALGRLPSGSPRVSNAAQALSAAVLKLRGKPWQDGMRTAAITSLGKLAVESSGPMLLDELFDDNPAVVRQAARSIEKILGLPTTVMRIVEVAAKRTSSHPIDSLGRALRWLDRAAVADELENLMGAAAADQQEVARALLSEIGGMVAFEKLRARTVAMKQFVDVLDRAEERVSALFEQSIDEARKGFSLATRMDVVIFALGIVLILLSGIIALAQKGDLAVWAGTGGTGVLGVLYGAFISNPRQKVRESVDHLMTVKVLFLAYLRRLHQTDQSFTRLLLDNDKITGEQLNEYSQLVGSIMGETLAELAKGKT